MKKKVLLCGLIAISIVFSACSAKKSASGNSAPAPAAQAKMDSLSINNSNNTAETAKAAGVDTKASAKVEEKKIITNASIYIIEDDLEKLSQAINKKTQELNGYIESEETLENKITVRVRIPADKFDTFMSYTEKGFSVKNKSISSENVTDAYVDNDARLKNLRAQEEQVLSILKKANTVEEVLKVQAELYKIRGDAEALEAKKKSWDKQVDYATITLNADKKIIVAETKKTIIGGSDFIKSIGKGFTNTSVALILAVENILIFVFSNIIVLGIFVVAGVFGYKRYKKYMKNNQL
ncbi:DUF4349 domain-containing protein [Clostridium sp. YIM B02515]|uniref:DUF4349 domain-containing protein n=1 Tax=Clostridium rhizosphaerae TaxID=2803861 RepID=A0ABS1TCN9_9CLOT|nr:DUF4349 domain-containing protein [Clostridium rhizosphaerae]MBL4936396.1 DUF4349 domain-containing protein [Clostridium rhizosphaerae]